MSRLGGVVTTVTTVTTETPRHPLTYVYSNSNFDCALLTPYLFISSSPHMSPYTDLFHFDSSRFQTSTLLPSTVPQHLRSSLPSTYTLRAPRPQINKMHLCKPMIRSIDALAFKDYFQIGQRVTYKLVC